MRRFNAQLLSHLTRTRHDIIPTAKVTPAVVTDASCEQLPCIRIKGTRWVRSAARHCTVYHDNASAGNGPTDGRLDIVSTDDAYISPCRKEGNIALIKCELPCLHSKLISSKLIKIYSISFIEGDLEKNRRRRRWRRNRREENPPPSLTLQK